MNTWVWDDGTEYGLPRIGVEAVADQWETHDIQFNLAFADGRVLNMFGTGKVHDPLGADGKPRILGAGPIVFELVKPFEHWKARIDGEANVTSIQAQIDGGMPGSGTGERVPVQLEYDIRSAAPPWESGSLLEEAGRCARHPGGGRPHGWAPLRTAVPRQRHVARRRRRVRAAAVAVCASAGPASAAWPPSAGTCGSRPCSRAGAPSACASIPRATTASPRSTRASSSRATASSIPACGDRRCRGCATSSRRARTRRSRSRPRTAAPRPSRAPPWCPRAWS